MASSFDDPFLSFYALLRRRRGAAPRPPGIPAYAGAWLRGNMPVQAVPGSPDSDPPNELDAPAPVPNPPAYPGMAPPSPQVPAFRGLLNLPIAAPDPGQASFAADEGDYSPPPGPIGQLAALLGRDSAPNPYSPPKAPDLPEFRGLLSEFGRGLLNVGIGGLNPSPLLPDVERAADEAGNQTGDAAPTIPSYSPAPPTYNDYAGVPQWKRQFFRTHDQAQPWIDFNQATGYLPGVSSNEKSIYREIFAAEGGMVPNGDVVGGIRPDTLTGLYANGRLGDWAADAEPADLTPNQTAQAYRAYMDDTLQHAGGYEALQNIDHRGVAAFAADTLFRAGGPAGTPMIQNAINAVRDAHGQQLIGVDSIFGPETRDALNDAIRTPEDRDVFATKLRDLRNQALDPNNIYPGERERDQYFRDLATQ
jgi:hypothetical protein